MRWPQDCQYRTHTAEPFLMTSSCWTFISCTCSTTVLFYAVNSHVRCSWTTCFTAPACAVQWSSGSQEQHLQDQSQLRFWHRASALSCGLGWPFPIIWIDLSPGGKETVGEICMCWREVLEIMVIDACSNSLSFLEIHPWWICSEGNLIWDVILNTDCINNKGPLYSSWKESVCHQM